MAVAMIAAVFGLHTVASSPPAAAAADGVYTVGNYPVDATAENAVNAKQQALSDGQQAAFRALLKRIVPVTAYKQLSSVKDIKAASLISGLTVRSERNSATAYLANLDFSFQADRVRSELASRGVPYVDQQAPAITLVTAQMSGTPAAVSNDTGAWRQAWAGLDLDHTVTPARMADLKPEIQADAVQKLLAGNDEGLRALTAAYNSKLVVAAIAEPDKAARRLTITLAGRDAVGPLLLKRVYRVSDGDFDYSAQLAAIVALGVLEGRWKAIKSAGEAHRAAAAAAAPVWEAATGGNGEDVALVAEFVNSSQWDRIRTQLLDTPGVDALNIESVSASNAHISLQFPGGARGLANALGSRGISLMDTGSGWVLRPNY
ncbi:DUF2066 domain-containing protein [Hyphomicrobium methylovorum]|nr:DUF2066 domain-containing protein [Hyphomicrobium methylovorum]MBA2125784.1 DUF2066 domain-containing protein [Hyphomicrobium methylovorum]